MGAVAIITLILAVPTALVALFSLFKKAKSTQNNTNPPASERAAAQYAYELTCVYAPKAFLVVSLFSFNYQNANPTVQGRSSTSSSPSLVETEVNNVDEHDIDNSNEVSNKGIDVGLPRHRQDLHD